MQPSYPIPDPSHVRRKINIHPHPLAPLCCPPTNTPLPRLPSATRSPVFTPAYTLTTHLIPSAYPRTLSSPLPRSTYADIPGETKRERQKRQERLLQFLWRKNAEFNNNGLREERCDVLWNAVNRFVRNDISAGIKGATLVLAHANGFPKETWEPCLLKFFSLAERAGVIVDEVWAFESVQHGDSALVNENVLGDVFDWRDNARDIQNLLVNYLPCATSSRPLPTHLPRVPERISNERLLSGFKSRTLVGVGHSLGGCSTLRAALEYPSLFSSLILIDPVIVPLWTEPIGRPPNTTLAIQRRSVWDSREEALAAFRSSPFFAAWNPAALEKYVEHGLAPDPGLQHTVRLKMSGAQEAIVFMERRTPIETWQLMPELDERIEVRMIFSGKDSSATGGTDATQEMAWRCPSVSNVKIPSAGHLVVQEAPTELGEWLRVAAGFLIN